MCCSERIINLCIWLVYIESYKIVRGEQRFVNMHMHRN